MAGWFPLFAPPSGGSSATWSMVKIGPGGNVLGVSIANDGTAVCRTDTGGCYLKKTSGTWTPLITTSAFPSTGATFMDGFDGSDGIFYEGTYSAEIAPSDSTRVYLIDKNGKLWVSSNQGSSFTLTAFTPLTVAVNAAADSSYDHTIAIDPQNPDVLFAGGNNGGFYSSNAGTSFGSAIATLGVGSLKTLFAFDPTSSVTSGKKQGVIASTYDGANGGVYQSTNGGSTWTKLSASGMPTQVMQLIVAGSGTIYTISTGGTVKQYKSGAWTTMSPFNANYGGETAQWIAADPANANRIVVGSGNGAISETTNDGTSWTWHTNSLSRSASTIPWLATTTHAVLASSNCAFNPAGSNELWVADGLTVWKTTPLNLVSSSAQSIGTGSKTYTTSTGLTIPANTPLYVYDQANGNNTMAATVTSYNSGTGQLVINSSFSTGSGTPANVYLRLAPTYVDNGAGIEQMINTRIIKPSGGKFNISNWDRVQFYSNDNSVYPSNQAYVATSPEILHGWDIDYAQSDPTFLTLIADPHGGDQSGKSTDGGQTWTQFAGKPSGINSFSSGTIIPFSSSNIAWFPRQGFSAGGNRPYFTTNGGTSWSLCTFPGGVPTTGTTGWGTNFFTASNGKWAALDRGPSGSGIAWALNSSTNHLYKTTDSGANWSDLGLFPMNGNTVGNTPYIKGVPQNGGSTDTTGWFFAHTITVATDCFVRSKNSGSTVSTVSTTFTAVAAVGFGKSVNGSVPAIMVAAKKSGVRGLWLSTDDCATWTNVTGAYNSADFIADIAGDPDVAGTWYISTNSTGTWKVINVS